MKKKIYPHSYEINIRDISDREDKKVFRCYVPAFKTYIYGETTEEVIGAYMTFFDDEVKYRQKNGLPMPKPDAEKQEKKEKMKQVPLRIPAIIYQRIAIAAKKKNQSFNAFVNTMLEEACAA